MCSIKVFLFLQFVLTFTEFYESKGELKLKEDLDWISLEKNNVPASTLRFPGKLSWDSAGKRLAISDTGQHRVLITDSSGVVEVKTTKMIHFHGGYSV